MWRAEGRLTLQTFPLIVGEVLGECIGLTGRLLAVPIQVGIPCVQPHLRSSLDNNTQSSHTGQSNSGSDPSHIHPHSAWSNNPRQTKKLPLADLCTQGPGGVVSAAAYQVGLWALVAGRVTDRQGPPPRWHLAPPQANSPWLPHVSPFWLRSSVVLSVNVLRCHFTGRPSGGRAEAGEARRGAVPGCLRGSYLPAAANTTKACLHTLRWNHNSRHGVFVWIVCVRVCMCVRVYVCAHAFTQSQSEGPADLTGHSSRAALSRKYTPAGSSRSFLVVVSVVSCHDACIFRLLITDCRGWG